MSVVDTYAERRNANELSRMWAIRDGQPWTEDEDAFLVEFWIDVAPAFRDEATVSQSVERTIEACRVRCEIIRKRLGIGSERPATITIAVEVCTACWMAKAASGACDCD